uniref:Uncharacterized protein n=1 Tax=Pyricularia oryzae (strain P131) TaxID=1143193 RepID=L7J4F1_PYRO1
MSSSGPSTGNQASSSSGTGTNNPSTSQQARPTTSYLPDLVKWLPARCMQGLFDPVADQPSVLHVSLLSG